MEIKFETIINSNLIFPKKIKCIYLQTNNLKAIMVILEIHF